MRPGGIVSLFLVSAGCARAPSPVEPVHEETVSSSSSPSSASGHSGERAPSNTAPEPSRPPDGFRECFAQPLALEPPYGEKPLPPGVASWIAEIDAAMPRLVARGKEPVVVVPLIAGDVQRAEVPVGEARYGAARTLFEHQHWAAAAQRLRDIAMSDATDTGIYAAQLYLECLNLVATQSKPNRPRCFEAVRTDTSRFIGIYCAPATRANNREQCDVLERIERDLSQRAR